MQRVHRAESAEEVKFYLELFVKALLQSYRLTSWPQVAHQKLRHFPFEEFKPRTFYIYFMNYFPPCFWLCRDQWRSAVKQGHI